MELKTILIWENFSIRKKCYSFNSPWSIQFATFLLFYYRNSNSRHSNPFSLSYLWQMSLIDHGLVSISPDLASWFFTTLRKFLPAKLNCHRLTSIYHYFCMICVLIDLCDPHKLKSQKGDKLTTETVKHSFWDLNPWSRRHWSLSIVLPLSSCVTSGNYLASMYPRVLIYNIGITLSTPYINYNY